MEMLGNIFDNITEGLDTEAFYKFIDTGVRLDLPDDKLVFQYTNWQSLFNGIIREKEDDESKVHLFSTNCKYLNDPKEIEFGEKYVDQALEGFFGNNGECKDKRHLHSMYLTSFSLEENVLPMWNTYGKNGDGLCIGFDHTILSKGEGVLGRCIYDTPLNRALFQKTLKSDRVDGLKNDGEKFCNYLGMLMDFVKNGCYEYEKEIRLVRTYLDNPEFRLSGNILVPYLDNVFPKEAIQKIIIGPCNDYDRATSSLIRWLRKAGMEHVEVTYSKLPFRND